MKLVYFSSDRLEVERLAKDLADAGIACEVRDGIAAKNVLRTHAEVELWIQRDEECNRAFMVCVERNAGFAKRETKGLPLEFWNEVQAA